MSLLAELPDADLASDAEPPSSQLRFIIGQDRQGHWIAKEPHGLAGGIFVSREAALDYAEFETEHRPGAVRLSRQPLELEL